MRILAILTVYNEISYLPLKYQWCKEQGLDIYVIDNYSNDGTWNWIREQGIPSHRVDTNNSFDLRILQAEIVKTIHKIKPDWVVYNGADLFFLTENKLCADIAMADSRGYNLIMMDFISMFYTGEKRNCFDPFNKYFYYRYINKLQMIHKYDPNVVYEADCVKVPSPNILENEGCIVNYGQTKSKKRRIETTRRREKAWKDGLPANYGNHYKKGMAVDWQWKKEDLEDVRKSKYFKYFQKHLLHLGKTSD